MYVCMCSLRREYRSSNQSVKNERRRIISSPEQTKFSDAEVTRRRSIFTFHTYLASPSKTKRVVSRGLADFLLRCWIPRIAFTIQAPKVPPPRTPHLLILFGVEEVQSIDSADQQRLLLRDAVWPSCSELHDGSRRCLKGTWEGVPCARGERWERGGIGGGKKNLVCGRVLWINRRLKV